MLGRGLGRRGRPGLLRTVGRTAAVVGTATVVHGAVQGQQQNKAQTQQDAAAYQQQQAAAAQPAYAPPAPAYEPPPAAPAESSTSTMLDQLTTLGALKESGVLTQEEFDAQKAKLLNA